MWRPVKKNREINSNDFDGDKRISFNAANVVRNAKRLENLPENYKHAALLFYDGCRNYMAHKFPLTFKPGSGKKTDTFVAMQDLTITIMNETGHDVDKIRNTLLYDILTMLEKMGEKAARTKRKK